MARLINVHEEGPKSGHKRSVLIQLSRLEEPHDVNHIKSMILRKMAHVLVQHIHERVNVCLLDGVLPIYVLKKHEHPQKVLKCNGRL